MYSIRGIYSATVSRCLTINRPASTVTVLWLRKIQAPTGHDVSPNGEGATTLTLMLKVRGRGKLS